MKKLAWRILSCLFFTLVFLAPSCTSENGDSDDDDQALSDDDADDDAANGDDDDTSFLTDDDTGGPADDDTDGSYLELVDGGLFDPAESAIAHATNGSDYLVAGKAGRLILYTVLPSGETKQKVLAENAGTPRLAIDNQDVLHLLYHDLHRNTLVYQTNASGEWKSETVAADFESVSSLWLNYDLTLDADGNPHAVYTHTSLIYTKRTADGWVEEIADLNVTLYASLRIAPDGQPHVLCSDRTLNKTELVYLTRQEKGWRRQVVQSHVAEDFSGELPVLFYFTGPALAFDNQGAPRLAFHFVTAQSEFLFFTYSSRLFHAVLDGGEWRIEMLKGTNADQPATTLEIDANDISHLVFGPGTGGTNQTAYYWNSASGLATLATAAFGTADLVLDAAGTPHVSLFVESTFRRAVKSGANWETDILDTAANVGKAAVMALAPDESLQTVYFNQNGSLIYADNSTGEWLFETIQKMPKAPDDAGLAIDSDGAAHLCLTNDNTQLLYYLTNRGGSWIAEIVPLEKIPGGHCDIAVDDQNNPHLAVLGLDPIYQNEGLVTHAEKQGEDWLFEETYYKAHDDELAIDLLADGTIRIAYMDYYPHLAERIVGDWDEEIIDEFNQYPEYIDLGHDTAGNPLVVYSLWGGWYLRFATRSAGAWQASTIFDAGDQDNIGQVALAVGPDQRLEVLYAIKDDTWSLNQASSFDGGSQWNFTWLTALENGLPYPSTAIGQSGRLHTFYTSGGAVWHGSYRQP